MGVLLSIREGKYDTILDSIVREVSNRKLARMDDLQIGDKVRFSRMARPTYLRGRIATITEFRRSRIKVIFDDPPLGTRFARGCLAHPQSLEPIEKKEV